MRGILDVFSPEILELITREYQKCDPEHFRNLRLVSKVVNELVEPLVFSTVTFYFMKEEEPNHIPELLKYIISGASPFVRWAKELHIRDMVPTAADGWLEHDPWLGEEREMMLASQKEDLVPAIKSLIRVQHVKFTVNEGESFKDPLCAVAELPGLRDLELTFSYSFDFVNTQVPLARFSKLRSLSLRRLVPTPGIVEGLKHLIASSPSLSQLTIICFSAKPDDEQDGVNQHYLDLCSLLEATGPPAASLSEHTVKDIISSSVAIQALSIAGGQILAPTVVPSLRSLTALHIFNDYVQIDPLFWSALQNSQIHLRKLTVVLILQPIIDYLLSYNGLEAITISHSNCDPGIDRANEEPFVHLFFGAVLPKHSGSLRLIELDDTVERAWIITQSYLQGVLACKRLECLTLTYAFPWKDEPEWEPGRLVIPLADLFSAVSTNLPQLRALTLRQYSQLEEEEEPDLRFSLSMIQVLNIVDLNSIWMQQVEGSFVPQV
ncbi:hypothetical protein H1R20_g2979, partial [Candolleomyces eurysporus]